MLPIFFFRKFIGFIVRFFVYFFFLQIIQSNLNDMYCWKPKLPTKTTTIKPENDFTVIVEFNVDHCEYYFERFATNSDRSILALGNGLGDVRLWNLDVPDPENIPFITLSHKDRKKVIIRDVSFSRCGRDLIFSTENGSIWLYQCKKWPVKMCCLQLKAVTSQWQKKPKFCQNKFYFSFPKFYLSIFCFSEASSSNLVFEAYIYYTKRHICL